MAKVAALIITLLGGAGALKFGHPVDRKLLSVRLQGIDGEHDVEEGGVTVNHLAKCGGRFVREVLDRTIQEGYLNIETEKESMTSEDTAKSFTIGLIRNPFEYYLSLWAFTSGRRQVTTGIIKAFSKKQQDELLGQTKPYGSTPEDVERFHKFVKTVNHEKLGLMSYRFHGSYLQKFGTRLTPDWQVSLASKARTKKVEIVVSELAKFETKTGPVACWVRTETLVPNLRSCLELYESSAAKGMDRVDWEEFNAATAEAKHNKADHVECSKVYDEELYDLVAKADKDILRAFNYDKQCHN